MARPPADPRCVRAPGPGRDRARTPLEGSAPGEWEGSRVHEGQVVGRIGPADWDALQAALHTITAAALGAAA